MEISNVKKLLTSYVKNKTLIQNLHLMLEECSSDIQAEGISREIELIEREVVSLENALGTLTAEEYQVIELRYFKRERIQAIASRLGVATTTVYYRINNAETMLQKVIP